MISFAVKSIMILESEMKRLTKQAIVRVALELLEKRHDADAAVIFLKGQLEPVVKKASRKASIIPANFRAHINRIEPKAGCKYGPAGWLADGELAEDVCDFCGKDLGREPLTFFGWDLSTKPEYRPEHLACARVALVAGGYGLAEPKPENEFKEAA